MGSTYIWHNINLPGKKTLITLCLIFLAIQTSFAQRYTEINLPNSDNHKLTYGFVIGIHGSKFRMQHSKYFINTDTLKSVKPLNFPGFSIGFLINKKIADFFDLRVLPTAGFYENSIEYNYANSSKKKTAAVTYAELPILIKYKSERRKNFRMYFIGGLKPAFEVTNKTDDEKDDINIKKTNLSLEYGVGMDIYYPMFKFSPELRFSQGLVNMLDDSSTSKYNQPLSSLKTYSVSLFLNFGS